MINCINFTGRDGGGLKTLGTPSCSFNLSAQQPEKKKTVALQWCSYQPEETTIAGVSKIGHQGVHTHEPFFNLLRWEAMCGNGSIIHIQRHPRNLYDSLLLLRWYTIKLARLQGVSLCKHKKNHPQRTQTVDTVCVWVPQNCAMEPCWSAEYWGKLGFGAEEVRSESLAPALRKLLGLCASVFSHAK